VEDVDAAERAVGGLERLAEPPRAGRDEARGARVPREEAERALLDRALAFPDLVERELRSVRQAHERAHELARVPPGARRVRDRREVVDADPQAILRSSAAP